MNTETWKVGIYCRLSKEDELEDTSKSIISQKEICTKYVMDNKYYLVDTYVDDGVSGTLESRDGFDRMMKDIDLKRINMVVVKDTSRLARTSDMCTRYAFEVFPQKKIRFVIPGFYDSLKPDNTDGIYMKSFFDEWYVRDTSNKVRKTFNNKRETGQFIGGTAPYGYNKDPDDKNKLIIDEYSSGIVKRIFEMSAKGMGVKSICYTLDNEGVPIPSVYKNLNRGQKSSMYGKWCPRTITDMLVNETYIGNLTQGRGRKISYKSKKKIRTSKDEWFIVKDSCPRIIDDDTWNIVQNLLDKNKNIQKNSHNLPLRGFLYCKECNHTIGVSASKWTNKDGETKKVYYCYCNYYRKLSRYNPCTSHKIRYEEVEKRVFKELRKLCRQYIKQQNLEIALRNSDRVVKTIKDLTNKQKMIQEEIERFNERVSKMYMDNVKHIINDEIFNTSYNQLIKEQNENKELLNEIETRLYQLKNTKVNSEDYIKSFIEDFLKLRKPPKQLLANLIDKIYIDEELNIEIYLKFKLNTQKIG